MKLKRITIHNIASIADAEIDFVASPLADTPLFLIAGPTGAGKSIILDSVCLALYARAPRLTRFKTDEKYEDMDDYKTRNIRWIDDFYDNFIKDLPDDTLLTIYEVKFL